MIDLGQLVSSAPYSGEQAGSTQRCLCQTGTQGRRRTFKPDPDQEFSFLNPISGLEISSFCIRIRVA